MKSFKGLTGSWTKYGPRHSIISSQHRKEDWYCQLCGVFQPNIIAPMKIRLSDVDEYISVCWICFVDCKPTMKLSNIEDDAEETFN